MKKAIVLLIMLISLAGLTACMNVHVPNTSSGGDKKTTVKMELDENYDDADPFINELLFCVSEDLDNLTAEATLEMDGEKAVLEIKDNKTKEVLWSNTWEEIVKSEAFVISIDNLKKENEYVVCFTGTKINHAVIQITFESDLVQEREKPFSTSVNDKTEKIHDDIAVGNIRNVNISGNAKSIVIKQSADKYFEFHNADLNTTHIYEVSCDENGDTLDISIMMENAEVDNNILGSVIIDIPKKEFEKIEIAGDFSQIFSYTLNSDVLIHANKSFVNLDIEADHLEHNIMLNGLESNAFRGVSVYLDKFPDNVKMELNLIQGGTINDPQYILKKNRLEIGSEKPVISINNTKEMNVYLEEERATK